eukprot:12557967-Alexandrium_andersonii.AAC.1
MRELLTCQGRREGVVTAPLSVVDFAAAPPLLDLACACVERAACVGAPPTIPNICQRPMPSVSRLIINSEPIGAVRLQARAE